MRKSIVIYAIVLVMAQAAFAQSIVDKSADHGLMVRQIPNSESDVIKYFSRIQDPSDTIYATIYRPANCPRCDGFINSINKNIKKVSSKPTVLISVYPDSLAAQAYIHKYNLTSDYYLFDQKEDFSMFLSFSPGYLHVDYILKINKSTGEIIVGSNADNASPEFFRDLEKYNNKKEAYQFPSGEIESYVWNSDADRELTVDRIIPVKLPKWYNMSEILYQPVFSEDNMLWNDKLQLSVIQLKLRDSVMEMTRMIEPDSTEYTKFINLSSDNYEKILKTGQLKNIALQPFVIGNGLFGIGYSLPDVWIDENNAFCYRNKPCYLIRSFEDNDFKDIGALEYDYNDEFYYPHFDIKAVDDKIIVGVQRITWPMVYDKEEYMDKPSDNPFKDLFYDAFDQPTLAVYDTKTRTIKERFGSLPKFAKKAKTGYSFSDMIFDSWEDEVAYASAFGGEITVGSKESIGCDNCMLNYKAFEINDSLISIPDTSDYYTYNCNALIEPYLNRKITDIKINEENIYCLIRHCEDAFERPALEKYSLIEINRSNGQHQELNFPAATEEERRLAYGLRRMNDGTIVPYFITSKDGNIQISIMGNVNAQGG